MKFQHLATLGLMVAILATTANARVYSRVERQEPSPEGNSSIATTESSPDATSAPPPETTAAPETTPTTAASTCGSGTDGGLVGVLSQLGNVLGNILANLPLIGRLGLTNRNGLLDLAGLVVQVQRVLNNLLSALRLNNLSILNQNGLLQTLLGRLRNTLNDLLGGSQGDRYRCERPDGETGGALGRLVNAVGTIVTGSDATNNIGLVSLVNLLLRLVDRILVGLRVNNLLPGILPPL